MSELKKVDCKYGADCYQKNPAHKAKYNHPGDAEKEPAKRDRSPEEEATGSSKKVKETPSTSGETAVKTTTEDVPGSTATGEEKEASETPQGNPLGGSMFNTEENEDDLPPDMVDPWAHRIRFSQMQEYKQLLSDPKLFFKYKFCVDMPEDFYSFWEFCKSQTKEGGKPECVFEQVGIQLVGPFDYMAGKFHDAPLREPGDYFRHWRFFYDPPEFQTVMVKKDTGIHYGYWRDVPFAQQCFLARNDAAKGCQFSIIDTNIFNALKHFLDKDADVTPFNQVKVGALKKSLQGWVVDHGLEVTNAAELMKERQKKLVCRTFHTAGLVVPVDPKTKVGYRPLMETDADLKNILSKLNSGSSIQSLMEELQPVITAATIAVDEGDYGTSIELAMDFFCHGSPDLHNFIRHLSVVGYTEAGQPQFLAILKAQLDNRRKGFKLSILEEN
ncbi:histone PARylation factor 1-like [Phlebotomus argentipes]|uniref:histone PARylation factor 1-like n=1 Tax=Phlebotomus argentipes TaxID=94469 RepID=UPI002892D76C|nr:histone PARylation factor 1-like [Phlebotomus argentipes]